MNTGYLSLLFFFIEFIFTYYFISNRRENKFFWKILSLLVLLQSYQLFEFIYSLYPDVEQIGRVAYMIITFLPPIGYHLVVNLAEDNSRFSFSYFIGYLAAISFAVYFAISPNSVKLDTSNTFYAVYKTDTGYNYGIYYNGMLLLAILYLSIHLLRYQNQKNRREMKFLLLGYIAFTLPTLIIVLINPENIILVTSVMCKFAISLALILGFKI